MRQRVTAVVLCGGRGTRLGGADKPLLAWRGRPLVEHVVTALTPQVEQLLISANRNPDQYRRYAPVVTDREPGYAGPLAGIDAALAVIDSGFLLVCPGDAPRVPPDLAARLGAGLEECNAEAAVAHDGTRRQPLHLLLAGTTAKALRDYLAAGGRSVAGWLERIRTADVDFADSAPAFVSLNTWDQFD
ncbi:MAG: molybdenum cofactor guanylyltransferase MobA [Pseudomonadales bacterium]